jgi:uncharacterized membrane protein YcaP (DUF421 family)
METVFRTIATYWLLLLLVRLIGRRSLQPQTPFELVLLFVFGGAGLQGIVITDDHSLTNTVVAVATIVITHLSALWMERRWSRFARLAHGTPIVLAEGGSLREEWLERTQIGKEDIMAAARQKGVERLDEVGTIVLERNGSISIVPKK